MKKILKYIAVLAFVFVLNSCRDEETIRIPSLDNKGPNVRVVIDQAFGFIDFENLSGSKAKYDLYSISTNLDIVELRIVMTSGGVNTDTVTMRTYTQAEIASAGGQILDEEITVQEMVDALGLTFADIAGGDNFTLLNRTTMADGAVYPQNTVEGNSNVTPNITASSGTTSFFSAYVYFVGCPSDPLSFEGDYTSEILAGNYFGPGWSTNDNVTIAFKGPEPFRYVISDISALAYVPFGGTAYPGDMYDICGVPQMLPTNTFGNTVDTGGGSWDPVNGVLILNVFEQFNGLTWTIQFTRK